MAFNEKIEERLHLCSLSLWLALIIEKKRNYWPSLSLSLSFIQQIINERKRRVMGY